MWVGKYLCATVGTGLPGDRVSVRSSTGLSPRPVTSTTPTPQTENSQPPFSQGKLLEFPSTLGFGRRNLRPEEKKKKKKFIPPLKV